ncbi:hypothetical protein C0992_006858, partial [Termitomyces sp. T32_za158]
MLFFRSIFLVAAAAFVSSTFASPIQESGVDLVTQRHTDAKPCSRQDVNVSDADVIGAENYRHDTGHEVGARETLQSLPDILSSANDQLMAVQEEAESLGQNERNVNVDAIQTCLDRVQGILVVVLADIKPLVGKPIDVILGGCAVLELAGLL